MDELKPQESEAMDILEAMLDAADVESTTHTGVTNWDKPVRSGNCRILADDATKLRQYIADRRAAPENKALTCEGCVRHNSDAPWPEICSECKRQPRQDMYHSKPEGSEKS